MTNTTYPNKNLDDRRWEAVIQRQAAEDFPFFYAVRTTGIYCRLGCAARTPNRENVIFFESCESAETAGYRPCLRCRPSETQSEFSTELAIKICQLIESSDKHPSLEKMAYAVGLSPHHVLRTFKAEIGISPREYAATTRVHRFASLLRSAPNIASAVYSAGYNSSSRCYSETKSTLGMAPKQYRDGGRDEVIQFATASCSLGQLLVALTSFGICQIALGSEKRRLSNDLRATFPNAESIEPDSELAVIIDAVVRIVEGVPNNISLPLHIRGTAFQRKVWQALQKLPVGKVVSYSELAKSIGQPKAVRAVASACGANEHAIVIPCHRVIRADGGLGGYRWGIQRKQALLARERSTKAKE